MVEYTQKPRYGIEDLQEIVKLLRSPGGCPWDKEQDHHSIRNDFLEEAYEVAEAIDLDDTALLREELGDVLLQVVFHSTLAEEDGAFVFDDVCDELCKKLEPYGILGGLPVDGGILWCCTECNDKADIDRLVAALKEVCGK